MKINHKVSEKKFNYLEENMHMHSETINIIHTFGKKNTELDK